MQSFTNGALSVRAVRLMVLFALPPSEEPENIRLTTPYIIAVNTISTMTEVIRPEIPVLPR